MRARCPICEVWRECCESNRLGGIFVCVDCHFDAPLDWERKRSAQRTGGTRANGEIKKAARLGPIQAGSRIGGGSANGGLGGVSATVARGEDRALA